MADVTIPIVVGKDRRVVINVPDDVPLGPADIVIRPKETSDNGPSNPARDAIRAKMVEKGILSTAHHVAEVENAIPLTEEELYKLDNRPVGSKSLDEIIDEDRGPY